MVTFTAFYSHSFDEKDIDLCRKFKEIIEAFGFELYEHNRRENKTLTEEIIKHIKEKYVFIGVITKSSPWLRDEFITAYNHKKDKILIFYEEGIKLEGMLNDYSISKVPFKRENLLNSLIDNGILKTLYFFKERLIGEMYFPFYRKDEIFAVRKIIDENTYEVRERHSITSLNDLLTEIPHTSRVISGNNIDISINEDSFDFRVISKPTNKNIYYEKKRNDPQEFKFIIRIEPNLAKNEQIIYSFKYKRRNLKKFFKEDAHNYNIHSIYSTYKFTSYQRTNIEIEQPTKKLILRMEFPENYFITNYGSYVFLNKTSNRNKGEEERVKVFFEDNIGYPYLQLEVEYPKINHNYHLWWEPPSKKNYIWSKK